MTMLDRMRRHRGWLKWSLALVVLAFIVFYIPDFLRGTNAASPNTVVAQRGWTRRSRRPRSAAPISPSCSPTSVPTAAASTSSCSSRWASTEQILQQLIDERAAIAEAERLGLTVSDAEVAQRIVTIPAFQQNGQFAGQQVYEQVLRMQRPPLTTEEFEDNLRSALLAEKLRAAVTDWVAVSDAEVEREYRQRNEKVKLQLVVFTPDKVQNEVTVTDAECERALRQAQGAVPRRPRSARSSTC